MVYSSSCIYPSLYSGGHQLLALLIILHSRLSFPLFWGQVVYPLVYHYHFYILHYSLTHFTQLAFIYSMLLIYSLYSTSIYISHLLALLIFPLSYSALLRLTHLHFIHNFIFTLQHQPFLLLFILPLSPFHFPFIPYSLFSNYNIILYPFPLFPILHYSTHLHYFTLSTIHYILFFITILSLTITKHITTLSFTLFPISYTHIPITLLVHYPLQPSHYYILTHITYLTFIILYSTLLPTPLPFPLSSTLSHFTLLYFLFFYSSIILSYSPSIYFHLYSIFNITTITPTFTLFPLFFYITQLTSIITFSIPHLTKQHSHLFIYSSITPLSPFHFLFILYFLLCIITLTFITFFPLPYSTLLYPALSLYSLFPTLHSCTHLYCFIPYSLFCLNPLTFIITSHLPYSLFNITTSSFTITFSITHLTFTIFSIPYQSIITSLPFSFPFYFFLLLTFHLP